MFYSQKKKLLFLLLMLCFVASPHVSHAQFQGLSTLQITLPSFQFQEKLFGGKIDQRIYCTCNQDPTDHVIFIRDTVTKSLLRLLVTKKDSRIYAEYYTDPQRFILGTYTSNARCFIQPQPNCPEIPDVKGVLNKTPGSGTSKLPNGAAF